MYGDVERAMWVDPNYFGHMLGIGVVVSFYFLVNSVKYSLPKILKYLFAACIALTFVVIVLQASRGALLAVSLAMTFIVINSKVLLKYKVLMISIMACSVIFLFSRGTFDLILFRIAEDGGTGSNRSTIWMSKLTYLIENPVLFIGQGYPAAALDFPPYKMDCHNEIISILLDYGLVGILILIFESCKLYFNRSYRVLVRSFLIFIFLAFMTLSPISVKSGWVGIPMLLPLLFKLSNPKKNI